MDSKGNITDGVWAPNDLQIPVPVNDSKGKLTSGHIAIFNWNILLNEEMERK